MGVQNTKMGSDNTLYGQVMATNGFDARQNSNSERLVDFCNFHRLVVRDTLFEQVNWVSSGLLRKSNQI